MLQGIAFVFEKMKLNVMPEVTEVIETVPRDQLSGADESKARRLDAGRELDL